MDLDRERPPRAIDLDEIATSIPFLRHPMLNDRNGHKQCDGFSRKGEWDTAVPAVIMPRKMPNRITETSFRMD